MVISVSRALVERLHFSTPSNQDGHRGECPAVVGYSIQYDVQSTRACLEPTKLFFIGVHRSLNVYLGWGTGLSYCEEYLEITDGLSTQ